VVNSLQAMPKRPALENKITLRLRRGNPGELCLSVEDNGTGIPADILPKIFDPFFSTKSEGGTGLGLAISRKIIEETGGRLEVTTEADKGTCFTCILREARTARGTTTPATAQAAR
jgi:two-component system NtrC family sensor kinase